MALVIEDGTGKSDSNTYAGADEIRAFAEARGIELPADIDPLVIQAMDYIEAQESRMKGRRTYRDRQALSFPRTGVRIGCEYDTFPDDKIPANLAQALCHAVVAIAQGLDLMPVYDPNRQVVKRQKVDVIEKEFFSPQETGAAGRSGPSVPALDALLRPLLRAGGATAPAYRA